MPPKLVPPHPHSPSVQLPSLCLCVVHGRNLGGSRDPCFSFSPRICDLLFQCSSCIPGRLAFLSNPVAFSFLPKQRLASRVRRQPLLRSPPTSLTLSLPLVTARQSILLKHPSDLVTLL